MFLLVFHLSVNPKMSLNLKPWNVKTGSESFQDGWDLGPGKEEVSSPLPRLQIPSLECNWTHKTNQQQFYYKSNR